MAINARWCGDRRNLWRLSSESKLVLLVGKCYGSETNGVTLALATNIKRLQRNISIDYVFNCAAIELLDMGLIIIVNREIQDTIVIFTDLFRRPRPFCDRPIVYELLSL